MITMDVKKLSEDEAMKSLNKLIDLKDYLDECQTCRFLHLLHKGACSRSSCSEA